ncbi:hypothetical protein QWY84_05420 [Aquisalimonas lutea]|uniref:hypothetical protein n=1 Tax=Aquisalimonas lutea TaxID=1327750 RepID=UPI0025B4DD04|nr:hypothetical protein [Aquisalimonas lutea]MDN3517043.1 hypothetical protein [Aquisalimonas lutea]
MRHFVWLLLHGPRSAYRPQVVTADELDAGTRLRDALARYDDRQALQQAVQLCAGREPGGVA